MVTWHIIGSASLVSSQVWLASGMIQPDTKMKRWHIIFAVAHLLIAAWCINKITP